MTLDGMYFVEYIDGCLQVLPTPDSAHQVLAFLLCTLLADYARRNGGDRVLMAPFKTRLRDGQHAKSRLLDGFRVDVTRLFDDAAAAA